MDLFSLTATLALEAEEYERGLEAAGKAAQGFCETVDAALEQVSTGAGTALEQVGGIVEGAAASGEVIIGALEGVAGGAEAVGAAMEGLVAEVDGSLAGMRDAVAGEFGALTAEAQGWGRDMIENFKGGVQGAEGSLLGAVRRIGEGIKRYLGFSEPEEGPLSDFHTYAPDMMALFAEGVRDNAGMLEREVARAFDFGDAVVSGGPRAAAAGAAAAQPIVIPRQSSRPIEITVKLADGTVLGRAIHRMYDEEDQRIGDTVIAGVM